MKILMIGCFDLYLHPYYKKYVEIFKKNKIDFDFIYWNRSGDLKPNDYSFIPFNYKMDAVSSKLKKIVGYYKFRLFVNKFIKNDIYDKIICLTSQTMILVGDLIKKRYNNNYIFDYRDETYEKHLFYRKKIEKYINSSFNTVFSSPGFSKIFKNIDKKKVSYNHNDKQFNIKRVNKTESQCIRLCFWGLVRQPEYFKRIFNVFGNDKRFTIDIYGDGTNKVLQKIIYKNNYRNIFLHGKYDDKNIDEFAKKTDILLNCYSNKSIQKNALTVKMYDGITYGLPMIVQKNSFMDEYLDYLEVQHYSIDFDDKKNNINKNELLLPYKIDLDIQKKCKLKFRNENYEFEKVILKFIKGEKL